MKKRMSGAAAGGNTVLSTLPAATPSTSIVELHSTSADKSKSKANKGSGYGANTSKPLERGTFPLPRTVSLSRGTSSALPMSSNPGTACTSAPSSLSASATVNPITATTVATAATMPAATPNILPAFRHVIGKYEMGPALASGDFDGRTRLCFHIVTGAPYVVRIYDKAVLAEEEWMWERVRASIHVQRTLPKHENIVEMVECFETSSSLFILMQLFKSTNLTKQLCGSRFQRLLQTGTVSGMGGGSIAINTRSYNRSALPSACSGTAQTFSFTSSGIDEDNLGATSSTMSTGGSVHSSHHLHSVSSGTRASISSMTNPRPSTQLGRPERSSPSEEDLQAVFPFGNATKKKADNKDNKRETNDSHIYPFTDRAPSESFPSFIHRHEGGAMCSTVVGRAAYASFSPSSFSGDVPRGTLGSLPTTGRPTLPVDGAPLSVSQSLSAFDPNEKVEIQKERGSDDDGSSGSSYVGDHRSVRERAGIPSHASCNPTITVVSPVANMMTNGTEGGEQKGGVDRSHAFSGVYFSQAEFNPNRHHSKSHLRPGTAVPSSGRSCLRSVFSSELVRHYFSQVVRGVEHMHSHHVVHLGIAPDHILSNDRGLAKISNLISCCYCTPGTKMNELRGTRHTVAPEILSGDPFDPYLADAWSLGVLLYFMFHGRYPHDGANTLEHIMSHHVRPPAASIPSTAKNLLRSLLEPNPLNRLPVCNILSHPFFHVESFSDEEEEEENDLAVPSAFSLASRLPSSLHRSQHISHHDLEKANKAEGDDTRGRELKKTGERHPSLEGSSAEGGRSDMVLEPFYLHLSERETGEWSENEQRKNDEENDPRSGLSINHHRRTSQTSLQKQEVQLSTATGITPLEEFLLPRGHCTSTSFLSSQCLPSLLPRPMGIHEDDFAVNSATTKIQSTYRKHRSQPMKSRPAHWRQLTNGGVQQICDEDGRLQQASVLPISSTLSAEPNTSNVMTVQSLQPSLAPSSYPPSTLWGKVGGRRDGVELTSGSSIGAALCVTPAAGSFRALMQKHFSNPDHSLLSKLPEGVPGGGPTSLNSSSNSSSTSTPGVHQSRDPLLLSEAMNLLSSNTQAVTPLSSLRAMISIPPLGEAASTPLPSSQIYTHYAVKNAVGSGVGTGMRESTCVGSAPGTVSFVSFSGNTIPRLAKQRGKKKKSLQALQQGVQHDSVAATPADSVESLSSSCSSTSPSCSSTSMDSPTQRAPDNVPLLRHRSRAGNGGYTNGIEAISTFSSVSFAPFQGLCPTCHRCVSGSTITRNINIRPYSSTKFTYAQPNTFKLSGKEN